jgi:uncharacterized membrane protein YeaQ/YmgE (transglycosylase-associated protein family)
MGGIIVAIIIGGCAGWLAGKMMKSKSEGIVWNIILGIVGGFVGSWLFDILGFGGTDGSLIGAIITGTVGAVLLIFLNRKLFKR